MLCCKDIHSFPQVPPTPHKTFHPILTYLHIPLFILLPQKVKVKVTQPCPTLWKPMDCSPWNSPGQNTGVGRLSLLQGIFPTQGLNPCFPHCRQILYQMSHKGSPKILEWVAYPFSRGSSRLRNQTGYPALQAVSLPPGLSGNAYLINKSVLNDDDWKWVN